MPLAALRGPLPRISRDQAGLVGGVFGLQCGVHRLGVVEHPKLILLVGPVVVVARGPQLQHVVEPVEIAVGAAAAELGRERKGGMDVGLELLRRFPDPLLAARVDPLHPLRLVEKEHADAGRPHHVFHHALALVLIGLVFQAVGLVHDQDLVGSVFHEIGRVKTPRRLKQGLPILPVVTVPLRELLGERVAKRLVGRDQKPQPL